MISDVLAEAQEKMQKSLEAAKDDFANVRTGRANPALFQKIMVDYYGTATPLGQLAGMNNPEARVLVVTPYDKSALKEIERAIVNAPNLGANVGNLFGNMFGPGDDKTSAKFTGEPTRSALTDPPTGYRTPSPDQPYGFGKEKPNSQATDYYGTKGEINSDGR